MTTSSIWTTTSSRTTTPTLEISSDSHHRISALAICEHSFIFGSEKFSTFTQLYLLDSNYTSCDSISTNASQIDNPIITTRYFNKFITYSNLLLHNSAIKIFILLNYWLTSTSMVSLINDSTTKYDKHSYTLILYIISDKNNLSASNLSIISRRAYNKNLHYQPLVQSSPENITNYVCICTDIVSPHLFCRAADTADYTRSSPQPHRRPTSCVDTTPYAAVALITNTHTHTIRPLHCDVTPTTNTSHKLHIVYQHVPHSTGPSHNITAHARARQNALF